MLIIKALVFIGVVLSVTSCGQKNEVGQNNINSRQLAEERSNEINLNEFLLKQKAICKDEYNCPENIAKIVITDEKRSFTRYCTGSLISNQTMIMSSSCLRSYQRVAGLSCNNDIFIVFPGTIVKPAEIMSCSKILHSDNNHSVENPVFWKNDITVFKLNKSTSRTPLGLGYDGVQNNMAAKVWKINTIDEHVGELVEESCETHLNTWLNPFSVTEKSPMAVMSGCSMGAGAQGAPIIQNNKIIGVYSKQMKRELKRFLISEGSVEGELGNYFHFSNIACSKFINGHQSRDISKLCLSTRLYGELDLKRKDFLKGIDIHRETANRLLKQISGMIRKQNDHILWRPSFVVREEHSSLMEISLGTPLCLNNPDSWIRKYSKITRVRRRRAYFTKSHINYELPFYKLEAKINRKLQKESVPREEGIKLHRAAFSPADVRFKGKTYVEEVLEVENRERNRTLDVTACQ